MAKLSAKGTKLFWNEADVFKATNIRIGRSVSEIPATHLSSTQEEWITGFPSREVTLEALGTTTIIEGAIGTLRIVFSDDTEFPPTGEDDSYVCTKADQSAEVNGLLKTSLTFKPSSGTVN